MSLSSIIKQTEEVLEEVLRIIRQESENPNSVLCETGRSRFVEEEESLRERLKETVESESQNWRNLLCLTSPQAVKCLKDAEELRQPVKEDINAKVRTWITGMSNPPLSPSHGQGSAFNSTGARTPEIDTGLPLADGSPAASTIITSPLNMRCSASELSELIVYPAAQNDHDYTSDLNEAINTPLEMSSDRSRDSSSRRRSSNSDLSSEITTNPCSGSPRRPQSARRSVPAPPQSTRQSRTLRSPINGSVPLHGPLSPNLAMMSSIELSQHVNKLVSSIVKECLSRQGPQGQWGRGRTNCVDINGSNVDGLTLNNGGYKNSGAVVHKAALPARLPQHV